MNIFRSDERRLLVVFAALLLLVPAVVFAEEDGDDEEALGHGYVPEAPIYADDILVPAQGDSTQASDIPGVIPSIVEPPAGVLPVPRPRAGARESFPRVPSDDALPQVTAHSAILMEAKTGAVIYQRDADARRYPASTTKIMTLLTALEDGHCTMNDGVVVSPAAADTEGSSMWLEAGERLRLEDLLYGLMLVSGNDASVAIAEHVAGSVPAFAARMTDKAKSIGASHTHFTNACGLPDTDHYTTARDLARITAYAYRNESFKRIVSTKERRAPMMKPPFYRELENENMLLWIYPGANGVKTGYTEAAGRCVVTAAERDGVQLISVVLDAPYMWEDSIAMLDYGFRQTEAREVVKKGEKLALVAVRGGVQGKVALVAGETLRLPALRGAADYQRKLRVPEAVEAPVKKGAALGSAVYYNDGTEIARVELVAAEDIRQDESFLSRLAAFLRGLFR